MSDRFSYCPSCKQQYLDDDLYLTFEYNFNTRLMRKIPKFYCAECQYLMSRAIPMECFGLSKRSYDLLTNKINEVGGMSNNEESFK